MKLTTKQIALGGILLALMIVSQFFKNLSQFITGPIVNTILIIATLSSGLIIGIILSVIAPVTSFFISQPPIMSAIPMIIPCVMIGNALLCICTHLAYNRWGMKLKNNTVSKAIRLITGLLSGSVFKFLFMFSVISNWLIPTLIPEKLSPKINVFAYTFGIFQLLTALIGSGVAFIIWMIAGNALKSDNS